MHPSKASTNFSKAPLKKIRFDVALGLALGLLLSSSEPGYLLVFTGFWMGLMWLIWIPGAIFVLRFGRNKLKSFLRFPFLSAVAFAVGFSAIGLSDGEGSPVFSVVIGTWMVFWIAAAARGSVGLLRRP